MKLIRNLFATFIAAALVSSCGTHVIEDSCQVCHTDSKKLAFSSQFVQSQHSSGAIAVDYAGGRAGCAPCHSHELFVTYATQGEVTGDIANPTAWKCETCHGLHNNFDESDWELRLSGPVSFIFDTTEVFDSGRSNICANCHQSRRAEPNVDSPGDTYKISSTHYGPHHGAQANVLYGGGFAEISGSRNYPEKASGAHYTAGCTGCHMAEYADGQGGHSFNPSEAACNACHGGSDGFEYGGVADDVEDQLNELRDLLLARHVLHAEVDEIDGEDTTWAYHPVVETFSMVEVQAFFNWVGLEEDRSMGAHNPKYVDALLTNTIEAIEALQ